LKPPNGWRPTIAPVDGSIDVKVAADEFGLGSFDIHWAARIDAAGQGESGIIGQSNCMVEILRRAMLNTGPKISS